MSPHLPTPHLAQPGDVPSAERAALREGRVLPWLPYLLAAAVSTGLLVWAALALPGLPDRVPVHWGVDGRPDRWQETTFGTVATGPLVGLGMTVFLALLGAVLPAMTVPPVDASPWRRIRQEGVHRGLREGLGWIALLSLLVSVPTAVEVLSGGAWHAPWWAMPLAVTLLMAGVFLALSATMRRWARWADGVAARLGHEPSPEEAAEEARWTPLGMKRDPEDPALFPAKREGYGVGTTVNLATPAGRWLARGFVAVFVVGLPLSLWLSALLAR